MKIPTWFVFGCGLLVLNLILVLGGSLSRHASAEPPDDTLTLTDQPATSEPPGQPDANSLPLTLNEPINALPTVPSLEGVGPSMPNIVSLDEIKSAVGEMRPPTDLLAPLDAIMKDSPSLVSEQLSHSFFESMKLRLKTIKHLNQSTIGLVDEAAILYQRGEIVEAQKLLGLATQLRETTARLLVSHQ
jgi:hypothetical protein